MYRTHTCGELRLSDTDKNVTIGWLGTTNAEKWEE